MSVVPAGHWTEGAVRRAGWYAAAVGSGQLTALRSRIYFGGAAGGLGAATQAPPRLTTARGLQVFDQAPGYTRCFQWIARL